MQNNYTSFNSKNYFSFRSVRDSVFTVLIICCVLLTILPLFAVLGYVLYRGLNRLDFALFTQLTPAASFGTGSSAKGGIGNALVGTVILVGLAMLMSVPGGIAVAVYLSEFNSNTALAKLVRFATNMLNGVPAIIAGVFVYGLLVQTGITGYSALAASVALAVLMIPTIIRTTEDGLALVSQDLRWASVGVGASQYQTIFLVTLPVASRAILTGVMLAVARGTGETAPLIFTALFSPFWPQDIMGPIASLSVLIFNFSTVPFKPLQELAWAASFVLVLSVLLLNIIAKIILR
jgi:phosphate transport system permease protein